MEKKPLYRKVNSKARWCHHNTGSDANRSRNTKKGMTDKMKRGVQRGLDYTPLFKFLLSKVGKKWDDVYKEAQSRVESEEPIFYMVKLEKYPHEHRFHSTEQKYNVSFGYGESSRFSTLVVDENGLLQKEDENIANESFFPSCKCCTHTFNGVVLKNKYHE